MKRKFIIVDDHPIFRHGLATLIQTNEDYCVIAEASDIDSVLTLLKNDCPDIIIVDISLKNQNGLELVKLLKERHPGLPALVVSMHDEIIYAERAVEAGALGYVMKQAPPEVILEAISTVLSGRIYLSETVQNRILDARFNQSQSSPYSAIENLSSREFEILQYIGQGFGASETAEILNLSVKTIHTYRDHLKQKLQIENSQALRRFAIKWYQSLGNAVEDR